MTDREKAEAHLKYWFLNQKLEGPFARKPTEDEWVKFPKVIKDDFIEMLLTYKPSGGGGVLDKIIAESKKTSHSDASFGMVVKQILKQ